MLYSLQSAALFLALFLTLFHALFHTLFYALFYQPVIQRDQPTYLPAVINLPTCQLYAARSTYLPTCQLYAARSTYLSIYQLYAAQLAYLPTSCMWRDQPIYPFIFSAVGSCQVGR